MTQGKYQIFSYWHGRSPIDLLLVLRVITKIRVIITNHREYWSVHWPLFSMSEGQGKLWWTLLKDCIMAHFFKKATILPTFFLQSRILWPLFPVNGNDDPIFVFDWGSIWVILQGHTLFDRLGPMSLICSKSMIFVKWARDILDKWTLYSLLNILACWSLAIAQTLSDLGRDCDNLEMK